ncbi:unnamed protein product [Adineta steineri]|uniref:Uncharacterized protein n=1 Tax=Adineta steineri TaxID=433720 RepID=A0A814YMN5_9BILA|nr:unnamed protein product [Adineta steineri]CAF1230694.1 unnamed protein product [Adineta steineri]
MSKNINNTTDGSYETEQLPVKLNFLDCNCQCYGEKQRFLPDEKFYPNMIQLLIKPHYALSCTCQCGFDKKQIIKFSTDTGILRFNQVNNMKSTF